MRIALFPGTFDPITLGHTDIIRRALPLFDKIIIGIGINSGKQPMFSIEQRVNWIQEIFKQEPQIEVQTYSGLTIDFCKQLKANFVLRGIRNIGDYEYEKTIADMNRLLYPGIETIFLSCSPQFSAFSSTVVRDVIKHHGNYHIFLPSEIIIP